MSKLQEIMEIASRVFSENGFDRTTMRDLAKATNLTTAGLYYYIKSKEELLNRIDQFLCKKFEEEVFLKIRTEKDPKNEFRNHVETLVNLVLDNKDIILLVREKDVIRSKFAEDGRKRRKKLVNLSEKLMARFKKDGFFDKDLDVTVATQILIGIVNWIPMWFKPDGRINKKELVEMISNFLTKGFSKTPTVDGNCERILHSEKFKQLKQL